MPVLIDTYPDFRLDPDRVRAAITDRTKLILLNSPANPTGVVATDEAEIRGIAGFAAAERNVALLSDEIYREFCYDGPFLSPAAYNPQTIVIDGFSKSHAMTGWRLGFAHGPAAVIDEMTKLQQYTFVCAPQPFQWAAAATMEIDMTPHIAAYRRKRDLLVEGLKARAIMSLHQRPSGRSTRFRRCPAARFTASRAGERAAIDRVRAASSAAATPAGFRIPSNRSMRRCSGSRQLATARGMTWRRAKPDLSRTTPFDIELVCGFARFPLPHQCREPRDRHAGSRARSLAGGSPHEHVPCGSD